jgi:hypothetical protein
MIEEGKPKFAERPICGEGGTARASPPSTRRASAEKAAYVLSGRHMLRKDLDRGHLDLFALLVNSSQPVHASWLRGAGAEMLSTKQAKAFRR